MLSTSAPAAAPTFTDDDVIDRAVALLKQTNLSEADQLMSCPALFVVNPPINVGHKKGLKSLHHLNYNPVQ